MTSAVLTLNAGSSSLKFALYAAAGETVLASGMVDRIGNAAARLRLAGTDGAALPAPEAPLGDHEQALAAVLTSLRGAFPDLDLCAIGHRVVHGGPDHDTSQRITAALLAQLATLSPFAPLHQPHNLAGIRAAMAAFPGVPQIACFDTAFHRHHPWVNDAFALPRSYYDEGVRRYGFHGLSYDYIAGALAASDPALAAGRVVVAHLGNGASMCAMRAGRSVASTMGFSALDGLPMGTRCGQLDPGVLLYLMDQRGMSASEISDLLYKRSGLLGLSGISNDMRELLASDAPEAAQAIDYFTFRIRRELGAMAAALGGLDALIFTGGIGENAAPIRARILEGTEWMGLRLDMAANDGNARLISTGDSTVRALVIPTNEELIIARAAQAEIKHGGA